MVGINSNLAAASATRNLSSANSVVQDSIARLSSGNRIVKASDDVAGLSIGTSIKTQVSSLQVALSNTGQARSVLQIGDGALAQINDILSRQKALATQANAGSLGAEQLSFLNSEFVELTSEIDRIVSTTSFNGIVLLNGTIAGDAGVNVAAPTATTTNVNEVPADISVGTTVNSYTADGVEATGSAIKAINLGSFDDPSIQQETITVTLVPNSFQENGTSPESALFQVQLGDETYNANYTVNANNGTIDEDDTITFSNADNSSSFTLTIGDTVTSTLDTAAAAGTFAGELTTALADVSFLQDRSVAGLTTPASGSLAGVQTGDVTILSNNFDVTNNDFGTIGEFTVTEGSGTANSITVTVTDGQGNTKTFSDSDIDSGGTNTLTNADTIVLRGRDAAGDVTGETISINLTNYSGGAIDLTDATDAENLETALNSFFGVVEAGSTSTSAFSTNGTITGSNVTSINVDSFDDASYQGSGFGTFTVNSDNFQENGTSTESVVISTTLSNKTYNATLNASANGGTFSAQTLTFTATDGSGSSFDVGIAASGTIGTIDTVASAATVASNITSGLSSVDIFSTRTISSVNVSNVANTVAEGLTATSATLTSNQFDVTNNAFGDISSFSATAGSGTANQISVQINGITFSNTDIGQGDDILSAADGSIQLLGRDAAGNSNGQTFDLDVSGLTRTIDLTNQDELNAFTTALDSYFGSGASGSGGLSFQVGSATADSISISVASVATTNIYRNDSGDSVSLDITSQANAQVASDVLDNAINTVISRRAEIGAGISRFEFAARNIETSIANQDAARGEFLDADIAEESTQFASSQVKLQASISVLAQANGLTQNLLTLVQG